MRTQNSRMERIVVPPACFALYQEVIDQMLKARKYMLLFFAGLILLVGIMVLLLYRDIRSITIEDIQSRQQLSQGEDGEAVKGTLPSKRLPALLHGAVDQAVKLAGEDIDSSDAADATAILLNSKLSFKEMRTLLNMSDQELDNEEKTRIRELLLEKLTVEEIEALRSITVKYGKHLSILDPDYPIEAVGVEDEEERQRILENARKEAAGSDSIEPESSTSQEETSTDSLTSNRPGASPEPSVSPEIESPEGVELIEKYEGQLEKVKVQCSSEAEKLIGEGAASWDQEDAQISSSDRAAWLSAISAAEQKCDQQFQGLLASAEEEFKQNQVGFEVGRLWEQQYEQAKSEMRDKALKQMQN